MFREFTKFGHYDAWCWLPPIAGAGPWDLRRRVYSEPYMNQVEYLFNTPLENEGCYEFHYHAPNGLRGNPHTDNELVQLPANYQGPGSPCPGVSFWLDNGRYRRKKNDVVPTGWVGRRRRIGNILYLTPDWKEGDGGETVLFKSENWADVEFTVKPVYNRLLSFAVDNNSWHASASSTKERRTLIWWYHA